MPYADPARSPYCSARHLLRQLRNGAALRRNPLVVQSADTALPDDELVAAVQGLVDRTFAAMENTVAALNRSSARHVAILLRCDVLRESRVAVARDLQLSLAQFERERRAAMTRFLEHFGRLHALEKARTQTMRTGLARTVRARAMRLADSGEAQSALAMLDDVVRTAASKEKIEALICTAHVEANEHAVNRARAALQSASGLLRSDTLPHDESSALSLAHEAAGLRVSTIERGAHAVAGTLAERKRLPRTAHSAALLLAQAEVLDACGMAKGSRHFAARASQMLAQLPQCDALLKIDVAMLQCQLDFWLDPSATGRTGLEKAIHEAQRAGYTGRATFADLSRLGGRWAATGDALARRDYRALADRVTRSRRIPRHIRFYAYWDAADMECGLGNPWRAADAARNAIALAPNEQLAVLMRALLARACALGGRSAIGERMALDVVNQASSAGSGAALFSAKRTLAYLCSNSGRPKEAWLHLRDAADLASRYGTARVAAEIDAALDAHKKRTSPSVSIVFRPQAVNG